MNRREFAIAAIASLAHCRASLVEASEIGGIPFGIHTFSFHEIQEGGMPAVDEMIMATRQVGLDSVEIFAPQLAPFPIPDGFWKQWWSAAHPQDTKAISQSVPIASEAMERQRERLRQWRTSAPVEYFTAIRKKFVAAGISIFALNYTFDVSMTDAEIDAGFVQAKHLGAKVITSANTISLAHKLVPFAQRHEMIVAFHNTDSSDPDRIVAPEAYGKLLALSPLFKINLDVAHMSAAGYDPVKFLEEHHANVVSLHIHDRKNNNGASVPNGEGDTPLRGLLSFMRSQKLRLPSFYELEWVGSGDPVLEIKRDLRYLRGLVQ